MRRVFLIALAVLSGGVCLAASTEVARHFPVAGETTFPAPGPPSYVSFEIFPPYSGESGTATYVAVARNAKITIKRSDPITLKNGRRQINTEIIAVTGQGHHEELGDFFGNESPQFESRGGIISLSAEADFPARSWFGIFAELEFNSLDLKVFNKEPFYIEGIIHSIPPLDAPFVTIDTSQSVLLYNLKSPSDTVGRLLDVYVYPHEEEPVEVEQEEPMCPINWWCIVLVIVIVVIVVIICLVTRRKPRE